MSRLPVFNFLLLFFSLLFGSGTQARVIIVTEHDHNDDDDDKLIPDELKRRHILRIASIVGPSSILQPLTASAGVSLFALIAYLIYARRKKRGWSGWRLPFRCSSPHANASTRSPPPMAAGYGPVSQAMPGYEAQPQYGCQQPPPTQ